MNPMQKTATAAIALTITLTGAVLATAPMTIVGARQLAPYTGSVSPSQPQLRLAGQTGLKQAARTGNHLRQP